MQRFMEPTPPTFTSICSLNCFMCEMKLERISVMRSCSLLQTNVTNTQPRVAHIHQHCQRPTHNTTETSSSRAARVEESKV